MFLICQVWNSWTIKFLPISPTPKECLHAPCWFWTTWKSSLNGWNSLRRTTRNCSSNMKIYKKKEPRLLIQNKSRNNAKNSKPWQRGTMLWRSMWRTKALNVSCSNKITSIPRSSDSNTFLIVSNNLSIKTFQDNYWKLSQIRRLSVISVKWTSAILSLIRRDSEH